ncbi:hypothetical protein NLN82_20965 [Citrobacter portucalensis]|uniref:hypothetical protein n=1 Tax=Citrobacter portucalensis TaxID=1639133 RepID=UPI00226B91E4|nr:hypothetical protein [Citrobacter portucalensis]MCX9038502.1 hypothetical protein [Citrobacter portucalensis]
MTQNSERSHHNRRRAFYDRFDQFTNVTSLIFGSTAIYSVLASQNNIWAVLSGAVVSIFAAINLVVGSSQRSRNHFDLSKRFVDLEASMIRVPVPTEQTYRKTAAQRLSIEKDEPPVLRVLDSICYNEQLLAMNFTADQMIKVSFCQHLFAQFFDWRASTLRKVSSA